MRLVIFDDDAAIGRLVARVATMAGMEAAAVADAEAFRKQLGNDPPQVIVLDLQLLDTDGVTELRWLAERQYAGSLILMSGFDARVLETARMLAQALGLKLAGVLEKPVQVTQLREMLEQLQNASRPVSARRLLEAIIEDELILDFQPIVTRNPNQLQKLEALVRWEHPLNGALPPEQFLSAAESDPATIDALTNWVVKAAADAYQVLAELGVNVPLSLNFSTQNLHDLSLPDRIVDLLRGAGMPPQHLCIEITESTAFKDAALTMDILSRIRLKGISLSIDDFGTGYSSLKLLRQMPFSELKLDRSFVSDIAVSRDSQAIVKTIGSLAANLGLGCVAEGVETEEAAALLEQMGIHQLQGHLIAERMPVEAVPAWLAIWTHGGSAVAAGPTADRAAHPATKASGVEGGPMPAQTGGNVVQLTRRQLEVMGALAEGCSAKEIARRLGISPSTVKIHLSQAYSALEARNRVEAVMRVQPLLRGLLAA
jgi:EAL domain-containing protein (putative c-di-GMP-specific phosphodiesterase class I)/FixJ family two-component response regulator